MFAKRLLAVLVPAILASTAAHAGIALIGKGTLSGTDLSGLTNTLEDGAAANILGGMGSAIAWAGGSTFLLTPDRGPNASTWNAAVDNTTSWIPRYQTIDLGLGGATFSTGSIATLTPTLSATTLLSSASALNYGSAEAVREGRVPRVECDGGCRAREDPDQARGPHRGERGAIRARGVD